MIRDAAPLQREEKAPRTSVDSSGYMQIRRWKELSINVNQETQLVVPLENQQQEWTATKHTPAVEGDPGGFRWPESSPWNITENGGEIYIYT